MTGKPKLRGGIVGSGFAANLHHEGIRRVYGTDVDLVGVFSPTAATVSACGRRPSRSRTPTAIATGST